MSVLTQSWRISVCRRLSIMARMAMGRRLSRGALRGHFPRSWGLAGLVRPIWVCFWYFLLVGVFGLVLEFWPMPCVQHLSTGNFSRRAPVFPPVWGCLIGLTAVLWGGATWNCNYNSLLHRLERHSNAHFWSASPIFSQEWASIGLELPISSGQCLHSEQRQPGEESPVASQPVQIKHLIALLVWRRCSP